MRVFNKIRKPEALKRGDTIGVVAPAWSFDPENFKKGITKLCKLGFKLKYEKYIFNKHWSMAGNDKKRADLINQMFFDKKVKAIFCAKAGYGSMRTIPYLDKNIISKNPKIFIGYSDITALLSYLYKTANMVVFHGPVLAGEIYEGMNTITLKYMLRSITQKKALGKLHFKEMKTIKAGKAEGILVGGNMSLIMSLVGTPYEVDTNNKILFLEDVGESLETIDDYLVQLKMTGKFENIKGLIFGRMIKCIDSSGKKYTVKKVLSDILEDVNVPIVYGFPSGHKLPGDINVTLPFGVRVILDASKRELIFKESSVR